MHNKTTQSRATYFIDVCEAFYSFVADIGHHSPCDGLCWLLWKLSSSIYARMPTIRIKTVEIKCSELVRLADWFQTEGDDSNDR